MIDPRLTSRSVLITGGNSGIGAAVAKAFAAQGARVVVHFLDATVVEPTVAHSATGRAGAESIAADIRGSGGVVDLVAGNLLDPTVPAKLFEQAGPIDVLVNNAAHCELPDTVTSVSAESLDRHFAVNTQAAALLMAEFVARYKARNAASGSIINISTDSARAFATQIGYGASKAALEALTRAIAIEVGPLGISVNAVAPGPVQTGWIDEALERQVLPSIPLARLGTPEDIADAVVFLASHQARWISGQVIQVAGGHAL
jgi:3-oxoacyl-[acyl-carrier protein] reductase